MIGNLLIIVFGVIVLGLIFGSLFILFFNNKK